MEHVRGAENEVADSLSGDRFDRVFRLCPQEVKLALERRSVHSEGYSGHSFRIGAATTAAETGVGDAVIQRLGRWKSAAYKGYVQPEREGLAGIPRQMGSQGRSIAEEVAGHSGTPGRM